MNTTNWFFPALATVLCLSLLLIMAVPRSPTQILRDYNSLQLEAWNPFLGHELLDVPDDEKIACMQWACGTDFMSMRFNTLAERWRDRHPDLSVIYDHTPIDEAFAIIAEEWNRLTIHLNANSVRDDPIYFDSD